MAYAWSPHMTLLSLGFQPGRRKLRAISRAGPKLEYPPPSPENWEDPPHPHEKMPKYIVLSQKIRKNREYRGGKQNGQLFYGLKTPFIGRTEGQPKF